MDGILCCPLSCSALSGSRRPTIRSVRSSSSRRAAAWPLRQLTLLSAEENVRDIPASSDIPMTMGHYLRSMKQLTNQWTPHTFRDERRQRLYLKDIDCPPEWHD